VPTSLRAPKVEPASPPTPPAGSAQPGGSNAAVRPGTPALRAVGRVAARSAAQHAARVATRALVSSVGRVALLKVAAVVAVPVLIVGVTLVVVIVMIAGVEEPPAQVGGLNPASVPAQYVQIIVDATAKSGCKEVTAPLLTSQINAESGFQTGLTSPAGARGIAGFMPDAWATWEVDGNGDGTKNIDDPADAIPAAARLDCHLLADVRRLGIPGDPVRLMLAAYNAGLGAVQKANGVPPYPETQAYVAKILGDVPRFTAPLTSISAQGPGGAASGEWAPGVAPIVHSISDSFHISAGTYPDHHPDGGHAADFAYMQFPPDWTDGAPGVPGTGPQWQIAVWIANNLVDTGNAEYVGHHASIHNHSDPPGVWRPMSGQVGSSDPTYAHMNHIHVSWPRWYGNADGSPISAFPPAHNFTSGPGPWPPGPLPFAVLIVPISLLPHGRGGPRRRVRWLLWSGQVCARKPERSVARTARARAAARTAHPTSGTPRLQSIAGDVKNGRIATSGHGGRGPARRRRLAGSAPWSPGVRDAPRHRPAAGRGGKSREARAHAD